MPGLMDLFGGNYRNIMGEEDPRLGFNDALAQRSNSLITMGGALLAGEGWGGAMQGYRRGAENDAQNFYRQRQLADAAAQRKQAQSNWQKTFNRSGESPFSKVAQDLGLRPGTPEYLEMAKQYHLPKTEGDWVQGTYEDPDTETKHPYMVNKRTQDVKWLNLPGVRPPGSTPAATAGPFTPRGQITGPGGEVYTPPAGLSKTGRKKFESDVAGTLADAATGKMTEGQATASGYAARMEEAERQLGEEGDKQGLSRKGAILEGHPRLPFSETAGRGLQTEEYQNYRNARDAFVNASLRRESGATIRDDEFLRQERIFFPQPGEGETQIMNKAALRKATMDQMKRAAGPGYKSPPPLAPRETPPPRPAAGAPAPKPGTVRNGYVFKGGDPSQEKNWTSVK